MQLKKSILFVPAFCALALAQTQKPKLSADKDLPLQLSRETPLPANSRVALALSQKAMEADLDAKPGSGGRVILTYGAGTPTIICALLKVTEIDLEPGETISKDGVDLGDSTEFLVSTRRAGTGRDAYDYLVLKPSAQDIETTMTVGTDRRVYYFRIRSTENQFLSRVAFSYPEEETVKAKALQEQSLILTQRQVASLAAAPPPPPPVKKWSYTIRKKGRDADYLVPLSVGDDGAHTHIQFSEEARTRGLPVLQIRDATGPIPANSHWETNTLIVDALFKDGCLLQGVGKKQQSVCIHNEKSGKETSHDGN
jgi:P-type conjugative transfer protein TrbG